MSKKSLVVILIFILLTSVFVVTSFSRVWLKLSGGQSGQSKQIINTPEIFEVGSTQVNFVFEKVGNPQPAGGEYTVNLKVDSITGVNSIDVTGLQLRIKYSDGLIINSLPANMGKSNVSFDSVKNNTTRKTIDAYFIADGDDATPFPTLTTGETLLSFKVSSTSVASYKVGFDSTFANSVFLSDATTDAMGTLPGDLDINFVDVQNTPPVISGTPAVTVNENEDYTFTPTASDADNDTLTFSITNKPAWASFDTTTGKLSGKPVNADIGEYNSITISVSDGKISVSLSPFNITVKPQSIFGISAVPTPGSYPLDNGEDFFIQITPTDINILPDSIFYTLDGTEPNISSIEYIRGNNITLEIGTTRVRAIAKKAGFSDSILDGTYTLTSGLLKGDLNGDNKVDSADAVIILNAYLGKSQIDVKLMDLNLDGKVDFLDVVEVAELAEGTQ